MDSLGDVDMAEMLYFIKINSLTKKSFSISCFFCQITRKNPAESALMGQPGR